MDRATKAAHIKPGPGKASNAGGALMSTTARENNNTIKATNSLEPHIGKSSKPKGLLGLNGREF